jgi:hypothetical protein
MAHTEIDIKFVHTCTQLCCSTSTGVVPTVPADLSRISYSLLVEGVVRKVQTRIKQILGVINSIVVSGRIESYKGLVSRFAPFKVWVVLSVLLYDSILAL